MKQSENKKPTLKLRSIKQEQFEKFTPDEKWQYIVSESIVFAQLLIGTIDKWQAGDAVKCLGCLQASIILHKMRRFVPDEEYMHTAAEFLKNLQVDVNAGLAQGLKQDIQKTGKI